MRTPVDRPQNAGKLLDVIEVEIPGQKHTLPIGVGLGDGVHGQQVVFVVLEDEAGYRSGRQQRRERPYPRGFAVDALRAAEPIHGDAQLCQRLFDHPRLARRPFHKDSAIGDAAGERGDGHLFSGGNVGVLAQIDQQLSGLFDVECSHLGCGCRIGGQSEKLHALYTTQRTCPVSTAEPLRG